MGLTREQVYTVIEDEFLAGDILSRGFESFEDIRELTFPSCAEEIESLKGLEECTNLEVIDFNATQVSDCSCLKGLSKLKVLRLNYGSDIHMPYKYINDFTFLRYLPQLEELKTHINSNELLEHIPNLAKLRLLDLVAENVSDFSILESLNKLENVSIATAHHSSNNPLIIPFDKIVNFSYQGNNIDQVIDINEFKREKLESISLGGCITKNIELINEFKNLKSICLTGMTKPISLKEISSLESLEEIMILNIKLVDGKESITFKNLKRLSNLNITIDNCKTINFEDVSVDWLFSCKGEDIEELNFYNFEANTMATLGHTKIQDFSFISKYFAKVTEIKISESALYEVPEMKDLVNLKRLYFYNCLNLQNLSNLDAFENLSVNFYDCPNLNKDQIDDLRQSLNVSIFTDSSSSQPYYLLDKIIDPTLRNTIKAVLKCSEHFYPSPLSLKHLKYEHAPENMYDDTTPAIKSLEGIEIFSNLENVEMTLKGVEIDIEPICKLKKLQELILTNKKNQKITEELLSNLFGEESFKEHTGKSRPSKIIYKTNTLVNSTKISDLKNLRRLDVDDCRFDDLTFLNKLDQLAILRIAGNYEYDSLPLDNLTNLHCLFLCTNVGIKDLSCLKNKSRIYNLMIFNNNLINIEDIVSCENLTYLTLINCNLRDISPLKNLKNLKSVRLENNSITDLTPLSHLKKLEEVEVNNNPILTYDAIFKIKDQLKCLICDDREVQRKIYKIRRERIGY